METDGREKIVRVGSRFILIELFIVIMFAMFYLGILRLAPKTGQLDLV